MRPKALLFDLDGTLIKFPKEFLFSQAFQVFDSLKLDVCSVDSMEAAFREFDFFRIAPEPVREQFMKTYWHLFDWSQYPKAELIPAVEETLEALRKKGYELAIVTSRDEEADSIQQRLSHTSILKNISFIIPRSCPDSEWSDKSKQIGLACERLGLKPKEVAMIGDIPPDIESAKKSGVGTTVALLSGGIEKAKLAEMNPDYIIGAVSDILEIF